MPGAPFSKKFRIKRFRMGGLVSGRQGGRPLVSQFLALNVNRLNRAACLEPGWSGSLEWKRSGEPIASIALASEADRVRLTYGVTLGSGQELVEDTIRLARIPCRYGGTRLFFVCPSAGDADACGRHVVMIYGRRRFFRCRHCQGLAYPSQREQPYERALRRVTKVRLRLGGDANLLKPFPERPERMHRSTYGRLCLGVRPAQATIVEHLAGRLERLEGTLGRRRRRLHSAKAESEDPR